MNEIRYAACCLYGRERPLASLDPGADDVFRCRSASECGRIALSGRVLPETRTALNEMARAAVRAIEEGRL